MKAAWQEMMGERLKQAENWVVLIVDDDSSVIEMTRFVLEDLNFHELPLEILAAQSAREALNIVRSRDDIAVALIDIIMENDQAGLKLIENIRSLENGQRPRLIVRTGQPGKYPEESIFLGYDIHLYLEKANLSDERLTYGILSALRSYVDIIKIAEQEAILIQQAKMTALGEMLGAITHQWKQPLSAISVTVQVILEEFKKNRLKLETFERRVDQVQERIRFLAETMNEFRIFFKPNKQKSYFNLRQEIENIVQIMKPHLDAAQIEVYLEIPDNMQLKGYPNEIKQVALNLLNNSRDAINFQEIKNGRVIISALSQNGKSIISFVDNGGGIPDDMLGSLFDKFASSKGDEGTGLGLHLCRTIIEEHHDGVIEAISHEGGAEFRITLDQAK